jgi:hypothetical protein
MLQLEPTACAKRLLTELPALLEELEGQGITEIPSQRRRQEMSESIEGRARVLGIVSGIAYGSAVSRSKTMPSLANSTPHT